mgnify:CR=1 FL=1
MIGNIILIIIGFALLIKGADLLVVGASKIAKKFNIPEIIIGLTVVAIGTSLPELVVSTTSALTGHSDIALGNVVGSNMANLFLILGVCSIVRPLRFKKETTFFENPFVIAITGLLFFLCLNNNGTEISRIEGGILLLLCIIFILYNVIMAKRGEVKEEGEEIQQDSEEPSKIDTYKSILFIVLGIIGLKYGGDFVVDNAVVIAQAIGISEKLISLTIVAISTSLPELITSVTATLKGETDLAIGNIVGSQTFNILLILGTSSLLSPISYSVSYNKDMVLLLAGSIVFALFPFIGEKHKMTRENGILFVIVYVVYMINIVMGN